MSNRDDFLAQRLRGIGGSDVAVIMGLNPYKTPLQLWHDKTGRAEPTPDNEAMRIGRDLEDYVATRYAERTGFMVRKHNAQISDPEYPHFIGNVDRLVSVDGKAPAHHGKIRTKRILECKTTLFFDPEQWGPDASDEVPAHYFLQCQWYMMLADADQCDLFAFCLSRREFRLYPIKRDDDLLCALRDAANAFWLNHVQADMPPDASNLPDALLRWGASRPNYQDLGEEWQERIAAYREAGQVINDMKAAQDQFKFDLLQHMKDADTATINDTTVLTYKSNAKGVRVLKLKGASNE